MKFISTDNLQHALSEFRAKTDTLYAKASHGTHVSYGGNGSASTVSRSDHTHNYAGSSSAGGAATSANKVNTNLAIKLNGGTTEGTNLFTFNGSAAKTINITPSSIGAAASSHGTHLSLGTTSSTAYRGDYGNTAYQHSQAAHAPSNAQKNSDITKSEIEAKLTGTITSHTHSYLPLSGGKLTGHLTMAAGKAIKLTDATGWTDARIGVEESTGDVFIANTSNNWFRIKPDKTLSIAGYKVYSAIDKPTPAEIGALSTAGGTITGSITLEDCAIRYKSGEYTKNIISSFGTEYSNTEEERYMGHGMIYGGGGTTIVSAGEGHSYMITNEQLTETPNNEHLILSSDWGMKFYLSMQNVDEDYNTRKVLYLTQNASFYPETPFDGSIGIGNNPWNHIYSKTFNLYGSAGKSYGHIHTQTVGTTTTNGEARLVLGNSYASGTEDNAYGRIFLYGTNKGHTSLIPGNNGENNVVLTLPSATGTLALTNHTHSYLPLSGGTMTGDVKLNNNIAIVGTLAKANTKTDGTAVAAGTNIDLLHLNTADNLHIGGGIFDNGLTTGGTYVSGAANTTIRTVNGPVAIKPNNSLVANYSDTQIEYSKILYAKGGIKSGANIVSDTALTDNLGTGPIPWRAVYAKQYSVYGEADKLYGYINAFTIGTADTVGECRLILGNNTASGTANNAKGQIYMYGTNTGGTYLTTANTSTNTYTITLPAKTGTVACTSDLSSYLPLNGGTMNCGKAISYKTGADYTNANTGAAVPAGTALSMFNFNGSGNLHIGAGIYDNGLAGNTYLSAGTNMSLRTVSADGNIYLAPAGTSTLTVTKNGPIIPASKKIQLSNSSDHAKAAIGVEPSTGDVYISNINSNWFRIRPDKTVTMGGHYLPTAGTYFNKFWVGTQAQYDAIATKDSATVYMIKG